MRLRQNALDITAGSVQRGLLRDVGDAQAPAGAKDDRQINDFLSTVF